MILISHRGNINGPNPKKENRPQYVREALNSGYNVEIDVWYDKGWWLGHDEPRYKCNRNDLYHCWCHAKNKEALYRMRKRSIYNCFWHQNDDYTLTSNGYIWCHVGAELLPNSICCLPEQGYKGNIKKCGGICSDYIFPYKKLNI